MNDKQFSFSDELYDKTVYMEIDEYLKLEDRFLLPLPQLSSKKEDEY